MTFSGLLRKNYNELCIDKETCLEDIIAFLDSDEDLENLDIFFLKRLTKVASHFYQETNRLDRYLKKIFEINYTCANRMENICWKNLEEMDMKEYNNNRKIQSHFLSHASSNARIIYERLSKDIAWIVRSYAYEFASAELARDFDKRHSAFCYDFAGDAAKIIFENIQDDDIDKKVKWGENVYKSYLYSAQMFRDFDTILPSYVYNAAADAAHELFTLTGDTSWETKSYEARSASGDTSKDMNRRHYVKSFFESAETSRGLFFITDDEVRRDKALRCYYKALSYSKKAHDPSRIDKIKRRIQELEDF